MAAEQEIEVKFANIDLSTIRQKLKAAGASLQTPERLMRRAVFGSEANPTMTCTYGRVRDEGSVVTMSAKFSAIANEITSQKEAMITLDSFENAVTILDAFGLVRTDYQENKRETWSFPDRTLVELETWPGLNPYIEIEGPDVASLQRHATELGLKWSEHLTCSTDGLYKKQLGLTDKEVRQKLADLRFVQ